MAGGRRWIAKEEVILMEVKQRLESMLAAVPQYPEGDDDDDADDKDDDDGDSDSDGDGDDDKKKKKMMKDVMMMVMRMRMVVVMVLIIVIQQSNNLLEVILYILIHHSLRIIIFINYIQNAGYICFN